MRSLLLLFAFFITAHCFSQSDALAKNYFAQGEYEKAVNLFSKLVKKNPGRTEYLKYLIEGYQQLEQFEDAQKVINANLTDRRFIPKFYVELGYNYALQNKDSLAEVSYDKALDAVRENSNVSYTVGRAFSDYSLLDRAASVYELGMELNPERDYNPQLAKIYGEQGKLDLMFDKYIEIILANPSYQPTAQNNFSYYIKEDPKNEANIILRKTLLKKLQNNPQILFNQMLSWLFIQQKDFKKSFIQEKAIFKRTQEDLSGLIDLLRITIEEEAYEEGKEIVEFVIDKSATPRAKLQGYQYLMSIELKLSEPKDYEDINQKFLDLFETFGKGADTYLLQLDYNHFLAFQYEKKEEAIANLKALSKQRLSLYQGARVKLKLADILVFDEKFNEALIYYSQVQKKVKNDVLAQEARFKVAQTSYFKGDFEWAQIQLDVLRKSASQLIANDAMELSLMIRDNSLEDSTQTALTKYATADLRTLQNKKLEAVVILNDLLTNHKGEKIEDEALLKLGEIYASMGESAKAEENFLKLIELYNEDILADDAHFQLAELYEKQGNPEKAKKIYEQIVFDFADSIYFVEARKRYRMLRGDAIN